MHYEVSIQNKLLAMFHWIFHHFQALKNIFSSRFISPLTHPTILPNIFQSFPTTKTKTQPENKNCVQFLSSSRQKRKRSALCRKWIDNKTRVRVMMKGNRCEAHSNLLLNYRLISGSAKLETSLKQKGKKTRRTEKNERKFMSNSRA